jgi:hypothetical protein
MSKQDFCTKTFKKGATLKLIKPYDIFRIASPRIATCLTIYVNHPSEITSLLTEVRRVAGSDLDEAAINKLLAPVRYLMGSKKWITNVQSIGIFITEGFAGFMKIPFETKNLAVVSKSFHVKPLLKWLQKEKPFFLLHLDRDEATLFQGSISELKPVEQFKFKKSRSMDFALDLVEKSVLHCIQKTHQPLILSGDTQVTETFKILSSYKMLIQKTIHESTPNPKLEGLHQNCLSILEPYLIKVEDALIRRYWVAKAQGAVSSNLNEIVSLAIAGQVKHLFINETTNIWGLIDYRRGTFTYSAKQLDAYDDDVLDDLAELVLCNGGGVTVLPGDRMPESQAASAILKSTFNVENNLTNSKNLKQNNQIKDKLNRTTLTNKI